MKTVFDISYGKMPEHKLDIYLPEEEEFSLLVYFHGGGLETGDKKTGSLFIKYLNSHGIGVVSANYRMYPDAKYPDFIEDAAEAVAWVYNNINNYGKVKKIYVGGSSAGGYLSQMLCFDKKWLAAYGISNENIGGYVHDAGQPTCHFNVLRERGLDRQRIIVDESAPLYYVGLEESYPPMLILVSDNDIKCRLEQTDLLVAALSRFGHTEKVHYKVMNGKHCAYIKLVDEDGESIFGKLILDFISEVEG